MRELLLKIMWPLFFQNTVYYISFGHFNAFVENFISYVTLYLYACRCHGLRLLDLNKETTYLLTYLRCFKLRISHFIPYSTAYCSCDWNQSFHCSSCSRRKIFPMLYGGDKSLQDTAIGSTSDSLSILFSNPSSNSLSDSVLADLGNSGLIRDSSLRSLNGAGELRFPLPRALKGPVRKLLLLL